MDRFRDDDSVQVFISTDAGGSGLNLQSASVLVNLDMPWNPAVLDQRIARVHRLGQKEKVQVILMIASDSYEERVMRLVAGKRDLFDNVVDPQATEDVVGVSKRMLETLVEDLAETGEAATPSEPATAEPATAEPRDIPGESKPETGRHGPETAEAPELTHCIQTLQQELGPRIERILGTGGRLLVVIDRVDEAASRLAEDLSETIPLALVDPLTLSGLQRLGEAFPFASGKVHFDATERAVSNAPSPLHRQAEERLRAAQLLLEQDCHGPAVELLLSAMLAAAADLAGETHAPSLQDAGVWLHGEILPRGLLHEGQATALMRALAFAQAPELPETLVQTLLEDARSMVTTRQTPE
jgi:hypothetical protein